MKRNYAILFGLSLGLVAILGGSNSAQAGGSGGGGSTEVGTPFSFDNIASINGSTASYSGTYTVTQSIAGYYTWSTISMSFKGKPVNLPDGTPLYVTVYTSDAVTGEPYAPTRAANIIVSSKVALEKASVAVFDPRFTSDPIHLDLVEVTTADGRVVVDVHP